MTTFSAFIKHWEMTARQLGDAGEKMVRDALNHVGFNARIEHMVNCGDILAHLPDGYGELYAIEVKTSRKGRDGNFAFQLFKKDKYGQTSCKNCDFVILLCVLDSGFVVPFCIPYEKIRGQKKIELSGQILSYSGKYKPYRRQIGRMML